MLSNKIVKYLFYIDNCIIEFTNNKNSKTEIIVDMNKYLLSRYVSNEIVIRIYNYYLIMLDE